MILMAVAIMAVFASCQKVSTPKATFNAGDKIDSLSYTMGLAQSQGLKDYMVNRLGVDTTYMADFVQGIPSFHILTCFSACKDSIKIRIRN